MPVNVSLIRYFLMGIYRSAGASGTNVGGGASRHRATA